MRLPMQGKAASSATTFELMTGHALKILTACSLGPGDDATDQMHARKPRLCRLHERVLART